MDTDSIQLQICSNIRKFRERKGLTREEFCAPLELDPAYWGTIERSERFVSLARLLQICNVYNASVSDFIPLLAQPTSASDRADVAAMLDGLTSKQLDIVKKFIVEIARHI